MEPKRNPAWPIRLTLASILILPGILFLASRNTKTYAQNRTLAHIPVPLVTDWSHRHMIYSSPSTLAQTWRLEAEPRYLQQWMRRNSAPSLPAN
jgi:hypothetical protein